MKTCKKCLKLTFRGLPQAWRELPLVTAKAAAAAGKVTKVCNTGNIMLSEIPFRKYMFFLFILFLLFFSGCDNPNTPTGRITEVERSQSNKISVYAEYSPEKIDILPLTEYIIDKEAQQGEIRLFVSLLDAFGSQIKSPCTFRFELYPKVQRSSDPKGGRVMIWADMDLTDPKVNNDYWQNFLRAYKFSLLFELQSNQTYILEVTCMCPNSRYLSSEYTLKIEGDSE